MYNLIYLGHEPLSDAYNAWKMFCRDIRRATKRPTHGFYPVNPFSILIIISTPFESFWMRIDAYIFWSTGRAILPGGQNSMICLGPTRVAFVTPWNHHADRILVCVTHTTRYILIAIRHSIERWIFILRAIHISETNCPRIIHMRPPQRVRRHTYVFGSRTIMAIIPSSCVTYNDIISRFHKWFENKE